MDDMRKKLEELEQRRASLTQGGGSAQIEKQHQRGKLTARERIAKLLDPGTFVELDLSLPATMPPASSPRVRAASRALRRSR